MTNATHVPPGSLQGLGAPRDGVAHAHAVQFYERDEFLVEALTAYVRAGLEAGEHVVVVATPAHADAALSLLGPRAASAVATGALLVVDARTLLDELMVGWLPDAAAFRAALARLLGLARGGRRDVPVRIFGEMVDLLCREGNCDGALRLEALWNAAGLEHGFALLCGYAMGNFPRAEDTVRLSHVCSEHARVLPAESVAALANGAGAAADLCALHQRARALEHERGQRHEVEQELREALRRRGRADEGERRPPRPAVDSAMHDLWLDTLVDEMKVPLERSLAVTRHWVSRDDLPRDVGRVLPALVAEGTHWLRLLDRLVDVTRAREQGALPVAPSASASDLVKLVLHVVDDRRGAHPMRRIELRADGPCMVRVDATRVQELIGILVDRALALAEPARAVTATVAADETAAHVRVHSAGAALPPERLARLFDPFAPGAERAALDLFVARAIAIGHRGTLTATVDDAGTALDVTLAR